MKLTQEVARKVLTTVDAGLVSGIGTQKPGEMCVEAAVCFAYGLPHSDKPPCVGAAVRSFKIRLNDSDWASPQSRAQGMRRLAIAQLGSDVINQREFAEIVAVNTIKKLLPVLLAAHDLHGHAKSCSEVTTLTAAYAAAHAAAYAAHAAAYADAAAYAADAAAYAAAHDAAYAAAHAADEKYLVLSADIALDALRELSSPGCEFLYLCD